MYPNKDISDKDYRDSVIKENKRKSIYENIEREQKNLKTVKEYILWYLEKHEHTRNDVTPQTALNVAKIMLGYNGDVIVFNNSAHCVFDVWIGDKTKNLVKYFEKEGRACIFAYRIDGVDVIKNYQWIPNEVYNRE